MPENIITIIFLILCFGQLWALKQGRLPAVIYYICVATMQYFSFWMFITWDLQRACGLILVAGGLFLYRRPMEIPPSYSRGLKVFFTYIVFITIVGSFFWEIRAMSGSSSVYGSLRPYVQILNWAIILGVAWQISLALYEKNAFAKVRNAFVLLGLMHCAYALYQLIAFWLGLPMTGIRRPAADVGLEAMFPHLSFATIGGIPLYRVTSFVGEPRSLAAVSMLWIATLFTFYFEGKGNIQLTWQCFFRCSYLS